MAGFRGGSGDGAMSMRRGNSGIALVIVLWVVVMFTVIAGSFAFTMRQEAVLTRNQVSMAQAEALADAGVYRAIYELQTPPLERKGWRADGVPRRFMFAGGEIRVMVTDESAKIDLNMASDLLLKGLLKSVGLPEGEAAAVLDAILDWRDPDGMKRAHGAELDDYKALGLDYGPANRPFDTVSELARVLGVKPELYRRLAPLLTVYSGQAGVDTTLAAREVLLAIPGVDPQLVETYLAQRNAALAGGLPPPPFPQAGMFAAQSFGRVSAVRSDARLTDGVSFAREAVARLTGDAKRPVIFLEWKEGLAPAPGGPMARDAQQPAEAPSAPFSGGGQG